MQTQQQPGQQLLAGQGPCRVLNDHPVLRPGEEPFQSQQPVQDGVLAVLPGRRELSQLCHSKPLRPAQNRLPPFRLGYHHNVLHGRAALQRLHGADNHRPAGQLPVLLGRSGPKAAPGPAGEDHSPVHS